jgi:ATP-dependent HslUV protease ATP-binding subunit HslU
MAEYTPRETVEQLDRHIVGQSDAKKSVAIALRNRWRRQQVDDHLRDEIVPNNIIMIGSTGVGKTEIARRLAKLVGAPFVKVEASNYTEVGYMGRDVESIIRDLVEISIQMVTAEHRERVRGQARVNAEERLVDLLMPAPPTPAPGQPAEPDAAERRRRTREKLREKLRAGELEQRRVTVRTQSPQGGHALFEIFSKAGLEDINVSMPGGGALGAMAGGKGTQERDVSIGEARAILEEEESGKLLDMDKVVEEARGRAENTGIVFVDEIDKIAGKGSTGHGPDVSREGVQRDLLPIVEGSAVNTRHGVVRTDHVLFIAAGAFNISSPSDLIPEFQGRFPIRVELQALGEDDFVRILTEPDSSLIKQYTALLATEGCRLVMDEGAVREVARVATVANERAENIGARRLQTVMATLLETVLFDLPEAAKPQIEFTAEDVKKVMDGILASDDLARYIL